MFEPNANNGLPADAISLQEEIKRKVALSPEQLRAEDPTRVDVSAKPQPLSPHFLVGGQLAVALEKRAERLSIPPAVLLNGVLPVAASLLPAGTNVVACKEMGFIQPPVLWNLSVAWSGSNKSETSDIAAKPLYGFQDEVPEEAEQQRSYFTSVLTMPGLSHLQAGQPTRGCLIFPDEFSGFVRRLHQDQKSGRGDEMSRLLTLYDGRPQRGTFADKTRNFNLKRSSFSLLSTIQPPVLLEAMGDLNDDSGLWARFNLCEIPLKRRQLPKERIGEDNLQPLLVETYKRLEALPAWQYSLNAPAYELFSQFYSEQENIRLDPTVRPALQAYAAKQEGRCARVALILHCLQACADGEEPELQIGAHTMEGAIAVCRFYEEQLKRFYTLALAEVAGTLEGDALMVHEFLKKAPDRDFSKRQIAQGIRAFRNKGGTERATSAAQLLVKQSLAETVGDNWRLIQL